MAKKHMDGMGRVYRIRACLIGVVLISLIATSAK